MQICGGKVIDFLVVLFASFTLFVSPGPTNGLLAVAAALSGRNYAIKLLFAQAAGYILAILAARLAVGPIVGTYPVLMLVLKMIAATYLIHVAIRVWNGSNNSATSKKLVSFWNVFVTTLLNPKALIFAFGLLPLGEINWSLLLSTLALVTPATGAIWIYMGSLASLSSSMHLMRVLAVTLAMFAVGIAFVGFKQFAG
jgi:threonine/homoserine/homoserine lactone efflux protein